MFATVAFEGNWARLQRRQEGKTAVEMMVQKSGQHGRQEKSEPEGLPFGRKGCMKRIAMDDGGWREGGKRKVEERKERREEVRMRLRRC